MQCKSISEGFGVCLSYEYFFDKLLSSGFVPIIKRDLACGSGGKGVIKVTARSQGAYAKIIWYIDW